ncbi:nucleotidyltransferase family protein [bacterium]|nr:nucleotidyltransferase family protein [bacterium]MBU1754367.1 nucleotidyltransferase family protein [bacterium]
MKTFKEIEQIIQKNKKELKEKYGLKEIGIFGSYAKGEQDKNSDVDMLVEVERPMGFVKFIKLENHLSQILGIKADLVTKKALKPYIGRRILQEVQYV